MDQQKKKASKSTQLQLSDPTNPRVIQIESFECRTAGDDGVNDTYFCFVWSWLIDLELKKTICFFRAARWHGG